MLNKVNPLDKSQIAFSYYQKCMEGDQSACQQLQTSGMASLLIGPPPNSQTQPMETTQGMSEGGALLSPETEYEEEEEMEMGEEVVDLNDPFAPIRDILGEDAFMQLQEAMFQYPVVARVAQMATHTADGYVEGEGTPTSDEVPARLSDGEYVFSAEAVNALGVDKLEQLHQYGKDIAASGL